jgi:hypothetical protein
MKHIVSRSATFKKKQLMLFDDAFKNYILHQQVTAWGFQQPLRVKLPNGFYAFPGGFYTQYENGYKFMTSGASLGATAIQEAMILDPDGVPIARDTEDLGEPEL